MKQFLLLAALLPSAALASAPDWVRSEGKVSDYPEAKFFVGFGEAMLGADKDESQCRTLAHDDAKRALIQGLQVTVKSQTLTHAEETRAGYSEYVSAVTESIATLDVSGLRTEDFLDAKNGICFALATARKNELTQTYMGKAQTLASEAAALAGAAKSAEATGDRTRALEAVLSACAKLEEYRNARGVAALARGRTSAAFDELDKAGATPGLPSPAELTAAVSRLADKPVASADDAAWALAYFLKAQAALPQGKVLAQPFAFGDTRMGSPFSRYFNQLLEGKLVDTAKWTVVQQKNDVTPKSGDLARDFASASGADYALTGSYWLQDDGAKLIARLRRVADGRIAASAEVFLPAAGLAATKQDARPENYRSALADQKLFGAGELSGGGLSLEAWTNKGADGLLFARGEKMRVFVRLNLPGYVRLIYHLADGKRALLLDNYYVDATKVNLAYELPQEFECDAPFGAETLQAFASTEKFDALKTRSVDGYDYLAEDLGEALVRSRGMKSAKTGTQKAETRLVLTTMDR
jgi:hypothetical protein